MTLLPRPHFGETTFDPDRLIAGGSPVDQKVTIISGQTLVRGEVVGLITASSKYTLSLTGSADGSEVPRAIVAVDVDASGGDAEGIVYVGGEFAENRLILGTAHTVDTVREPLRAVGIITKQVIDEAGEQSSVIP